MTKEKDTQVVVRNFTEKGGFMIIPHLALFEFGCSKGTLLFVLISEFQDSYIEGTLTERGSFCCTQAELKRKTGMSPKKQTKLIKELEDEGMVSCYYSNVGSRKLKWFYFTKSNFKNIDKRLSEAKERLEREKEQEAHKNMVDVEGNYLTDRFIFLKNVLCINNKMEFILKEVWARHRLSESNESNDQ